MTDMPISPVERKEFLNELRKFRNSREGVFICFFIFIKPSPVPLGHPLRRRGRVLDSSLRSE